MNGFFHRARRVMVREFRIIFGDWNILLVLLVGPMIYSIMFGSVYYRNKLSKVPIAVVDEDRSSMSAAIIRALDASESISVGTIIGDPHSLDRLMMSEECWGAVVLPRGMERSIKRGEQVNVVVMSNTSNILIGNYVQKGTQSALATFAAGLSINKMMRAGSPETVALATYAPVSVQTRTVFNPGLNYANFILPLLFVLLIHQVVLLGAAMSWSKEFEGGKATQREFVLTDPALFLGKSLPYVAIFFFWGLVTIVGTQSALAIPYKGSVPATLLFAVLGSLAVAAMGAVVGMLIKDKVGAVQIWFFTSMPLLLISGGSWPLFAMPAWVRGIALLLPSTHMMEIYRRMALEGAGVATLSPSFIWLAALTAGLLLSVRAVGGRNGAGESPGGA